MCCRLTTSLAVGHLTRKSGVLGSIHGGGGGGGEGGRLVRRCCVNCQCQGRPINLDYSRARACCACSGCGWGMFGHFFSRVSFLFSFSLSGRRPDID